MICDCFFFCLTVFRNNEDEMKKSITSNHSRRCDSQVIHHTRETTTPGPERGLLLTVKWKATHFTQLWCRKTDYRLNIYTQEDSCCGTVWRIKESFISLTSKLLLAQTWMLRYSYSLSEYYILTDQRLSLR